MSVCRRKIFFEPAAAYFTECVWRPAVDVRRAPYGWLIKAELPGVAPDQVRVSIERNTVTLAGVRRDTLSLLEEGDSYYAMEISYCAFERRIELPGPVEGAALHLSSQEGLLIVRLDLNAASSHTREDAPPQLDERS